MLRARAEGKDAIQHFGVPAGQLRQPFEASRQSLFPFGHRLEEFRFAGDGVTPLAGFRVDEKLQDGVEFLVERDGMARRLDFLRELPPGHRGQHDAGN